MRLGALDRQYHALPCHLHTVAHMPAIVTKIEIEISNFDEVGKSNLTSLFCEEKKKLGQVIVPHCN